MSGCRERSSRGAPFLALVALGVPFLVATGGADEPPLAADSGEVRRDARSVGERGLDFGPFVVSGGLSQHYRFRRTDDGEDQDLGGWLDLNASRDVDRDSAGFEPYRRIAFDLHASYDLDVDSFERARNVSRPAAVPFLDATDTFGDRLLAFVHSAYVEVEGLAFLERVRVGRQSIHREESLFFDGAFVETAPWEGLSFELWGGAPVRFWESSSSGDALLGSGLAWQPIRRLRLGAEWYFARDARADGPDTDDHVWRAYGRWSPGAEWSFGASASWVGDSERRQVIDARWISEAIGLLASARLLRQGSIVSFQSDEISPYLLIEGEYAPYWQVEIDLDQPLGEHFSAGTGVQARELEDADDEGIFNRSFRSAYLQCGVREIWSGMDASLRGDAWEADGEDIQSVGFEVSQDVAGVARVRAGTSFSLWRIDPFTGTERERERVYWLRARWRLGARVDLDTDYRYERDSNDEYHTVMAGLRIWF